MRERAETPLVDPQAQLESALIDEFLHQHGCTLATVDLKPPGERRDLLKQASLYAATHLAEIDARAAFVHDLHGSGPRS
jgi:hypothetical protein